MVCSMLRKGGIFLELILKLMFATCEQFCTIFYQFFVVTKAGKPPKTKSKFNLKIQMLYTVHINYLGLGTPLGNLNSRSKLGTYLEQVFCLLRS